MLIQLHHQFKDGKTDMRAQRDLKTLDDMGLFIREVKKTHPLPDGAIWMACNEKSEHFIMTHKEI